MPATKPQKPEGKLFYTIQEVLEDFKRFENCTDECISTIKILGDERYLCLFSDLDFKPLATEERTPESLSDRLDFFLCNLAYAVPYGDNVRTDRAFHVFGYKADPSMPTLVNGVEVLFSGDDEKEATDAATLHFAWNLKQPKYLDIGFMYWPKKFIILLAPEAVLQ